MPSLNPKRQVRYTKADHDAICAALTVLEFAAEFDDAIQPGAGIVPLQALCQHIAAQREAARGGKPKPAAT